jgi:S1-C subfamily serine protease
VISLVHLTQDVVDFSREIITLKDHQIRAETREKQMMHPTVKITSIITATSSEEGRSEHVIISSATGVCVKYDIQNDESLIITNDHFCGSNNFNTSFIVEDHSKSSLEKERPFLPARIVETSPSLDLCLIKARGYIRPAVLAPFNYSPRPFEEIFVVGGPSGTFPIIFDSYVSKTIGRDGIKLGSMSPEGNPLFLISEQVYPGHSGSPVFTKDGEVIGIVFGALKSYGGLVISVRDVYKMLEIAEEH